MHDFMTKLLPRSVPRSAVAVILILTLAAAVAFAAVSHLVARFKLNQQARGRRLYTRALADMDSNRTLAIEEFRAALTCDPNNSQYQLSLGRALRDTGQLDEAESYLQSLWQRSPEDGTINLALARVAARRGSLDDATRYYHNAMYGVWNSDADSNRRKARIELIEFLLQKSVFDHARSELVALVTFLPSDPALHLQAAQLSTQAHDYSGALAEYEKVLHLDRSTQDRTASAALAGAGETAYRSGNYRTAQRYLQLALKSNPQDFNLRDLTASTDLILATDPFIRRISDVERNHRIISSFTSAGDRLRACAQQKGVSLAPANAQSLQASPLVQLHDRWLAARRDLPRLRSLGETDLPDAIMDVVFAIEQQTALDCGEPQGIDKALLLISRDREAVDQ